MPFQTTSRHCEMNGEENEEGVKVVGNPICVTPE